MGAVLVIPAIAALIASNYRDQDRVTGFVIIGATSGAAVALGPLIGGYVTTYLSWRYVFLGEVVVMAAVVALARLVPDTSRPESIKIDFSSVLLSASGLTLIVFGMLQSKAWGWILPKDSPEIGGVPINPLGLSLVPYLLLAGGFLLWAFFRRQETLINRGSPPLVHVPMLSIKRLRSGLSVLSAQYMITAGRFFMIAEYLQMTLGLNALDTGIRIFRSRFP